MIQAVKLIELREHYKARMVREIQENHRYGINFVLGKAMDDLFNELVPLLKEKHGK